MIIHIWCDCEKSLKLINGMCLLFLVSFPRRLKALDTKRKSEHLALLLYVFTFGVCDINAHNIAIMRCSYEWICAPPAGQRRTCSSISLIALIFLVILQLEMEKLTRVSTISGRTMFCHLDAPANAISVCRDATQVKTQAKGANLIFLLKSIFFCYGSQCKNILCVFYII